MLVDPCAAPVANPLALMLAIAALDEAHVALLVRFCVVPSLNAPVAVNCTLVPLAMDVVGELIVIDWRTAAVTVRAKALDVIPF